MLSPLTTKPTARVSVAGSKQTQQFSALSKGYKALSMPDKSSWVRLVQSVNLAANRTGKHKMTAANLYTKVNTVALACHQSVMSTAPDALPPTPTLPDTLTLSAGSHGGFLCAIISSAAYSSCVQVQAAPTAPAGYNTYNPKSFRILGTLPGLTQGSTSIAQMYAAKYGFPPLGSEVALRLVPMDPLGARLPGRVITGVVLGIAATDELTDPGEEPALLRAA